MWAQLLPVFIATASGPNPPEQGFRACAENFYQGAAPVLSPAHPARLSALCYGDFAVLYSGQAKAPLYVAEHLSSASFSSLNTPPRADTAHEETRLPAADRANVADFNRTICERVLMASERQRTSSVSLAHSASLSNQVCSVPNLYARTWAESAEKAVAAYVKHGNAVYVLTGPIFHGPVSTIGKAGVWSPAALFKLVYDPSKKRAWAYVVSNSDHATVREITYGELTEMTATRWLPSGAVSNSAEVGPGVE